MKSFLNFIRKNGLYAFINLFGLTVSLAFAFPGGGEGYLVSLGLRYVRPRRADYCR